jgi:hypothetical protein
MSMYIASPLETKTASITTTKGVSSRVSYSFHHSHAPHKSGFCRGEESKGQKTSGQESPGQGHPSRRPWGGPLRHFLNGDPLRGGHMYQKQPAMSEAPWPDHHPNCLVAHTLGMCLHPCLIMLLYLQRLSWRSSTSARNMTTSGVMFGLPLRGRADRARMTSRCATAAFRIPLVLTWLRLPAAHSRHQVGICHLSSDVSLPAGHSSSSMSIPMCS